MKILVYFFLDDLVSFSCEIFLVYVFVTNVYLFKLYPEEIICYINVFQLCKICLLQFCCLFKLFEFIWNYSSSFSFYLSTLDFLKFLLLIDFVTAWWFWFLVATELRVFSSLVRITWWRLTKILTIRSLPSWYPFWSSRATLFLHVSSQP